MREVYLHELGIDLPIHDIDAANVRQVMSTLKQSPIRTRFHRLDTPRNLCVAEMRHHDHSVHVGIYLDTEDGPRILHCRQGSGTVCEPLHTVAYELRYWAHG